MYTFEEKKEYYGCSKFDLKFGNFSEYILTVRSREGDLLTGYMAVKIHDIPAVLTQQLGFIEAIIKRNHNTEYIELITENLKFKIPANQERGEK